MLFFRATAVLKDALPNPCDCHLGQGGQFLRPPQRSSGKNYGSERLFLRKTGGGALGDVEATLWFVVQRIPLFKEKRMMVKLKNIHDDRESGEFDFNQKA